MISKLLKGLMNYAQATLVNIKTVVKDVLFKLTIITIGLFGLMFLAVIFQSQHLMFFAAGAACLVFVAIHWTLVGLSEVISAILDKVATNLEKDKKELDRTRAKMEKLAVGMKRCCDIFITATMFVSAIACWTLTQGFGSLTLGVFEVIAMASMVFLAIGLYKKEEMKWPRWLIAGMTVFSLIFWFGTLDTVPSRVVGSIIGMKTISTEEGTDKRVSAVAICNTRLYKANEKGDLSSAVTSDTMLQVGQVVRLTNPQMKTRRFDGKLMAEIAIERAAGNDEIYWVKPSALSKGSGLEILPSLANPEYGIKKAKVGRQWVWEVYFLTDEAVTIPTPELRGRNVLVTGFQEGELSWNNLNTGRMISYGSPDASVTNWNRATTKFQIKKGSVIKLFIS